MSQPSRTPAKALHPAGFLARSITRGDFMVTRRGAPSMARRMSPRLRLLIGVALLPLALFAFLPLVSSGAAEEPRLQDRAQEGPDRLAQGPRARALVRRRRLHAQDQRRCRATSRCCRPSRCACRPTSTPSAPSSRASRRTCAASGCASPACAPAWPRRARRSSKRLVELYKADQPDLVTVVLESNGFADLLERTEFMQRVSHQDARIIGIVRQGQGGRDRDREAARQAREARPGRRRPDRGRGHAGRRRQGPARRPPRPLRRRALARSTRCSPARATTATRSRATCARSRPSRRRCSPRCRPPSTGAAPAPAGPIQQGSGGLIWPVNGPIVSPFGMRWGRLHAGVDIAVPGGHADPRRRSRAAS